MKSSSLRNFAGGLIVATSICGLVYFIGPSTPNTQEKPKIESKKVLSTDEMKEQLVSKGYIVETKEERNKQLLESKKVAETKQEKANKETIKYRTILSVSSGMTSIDVGKTLKKTHIIKNASKFSKEVEKRDLSNELKPGTYEVESGMTMDEIIKVIFK